MPTSIVTDRPEITKAMATEPTSLEKPAARTPAIIMTPDEYRGAVARWQQQQYHVLTPFTTISGMAAQHGIISSLITINLDKDADDTYDGLPFLEKSEVALAKNGLLKIAEGLGISTKLEYVQVGTIQFYWLVKAIASYRGIDGSTVRREAGEEWDLRDGSPRLKGWTANQVGEGRKHGLRNCETRAISAAIRSCGCGVKQAYLRTELARPFVAVRVMFVPDMEDETTRRLVTEGFVRGTDAMYPALPAVREVIDAETSEPRTVGRGSTATSAAGAAAADEPPTPEAIRIVKVESKSGEKNGKAWTRFVIVDSTGTEHSTFSKSIADFAEKARDAKQWVEIAEESDGQYRNLLEITAAGQQPSLLPDPSAL